MTTETSPAADAAVPAPSRGFIPRLGSGLAFFPLGIYTVWHLWQNMSARLGASAWESHVASAHAPIAELTMSTVVLLPVVLHSAWGIRRLVIVKSNLRAYRTFDNLRFVLQRLSALGLLAFLVAHLWLARLQPLIETRRHETFADISWHMRNHPPTLVVYILGVLATAYHLANGVATGGMTWGYAATERARRRMTVISIVGFGALLVMGWGSIYALWDAGANQHLEARAHDAAEPGTDSRDSH